VIVEQRRMVVLPNPESRIPTPENSTPFA